MLRTKCGSPADNILRLLGVGHEVTLEAADWRDAVAMFIIQQKLEFDRAGQLDPATQEAFVGLLLRAKIRQGVEDAARQIADILGPVTTQEQAEGQIRELCAAGYLTEEDVDEILLRK